MKKYLFGFFLLVQAVVPRYGYPQEKYPWGNADMIIKGNKILVLSQQGTVSAIDINTGKTVADPPERNNNFVAIDTDRKGNIILSRFDRSIVKLDEKTLTFKELYTVPKPIYDVVFDSNDKAYAITSDGIADLSTGISYSPDTSFYINKQIRKWLKPSAITVDANNNIWLGNEHGEWGGQVFVFSTSKKEFVKTNIGTIKEKNGRFAVVSLYETQSIINVGKSVYVSFNFGNYDNDGYIMRFNDLKCDSVLTSKNLWPPEVTIVGDMTIQQVSSGDYAGPALYNQKDNCLYFYSHDLILKGPVNKDISKPEAWTRFSINRKWATQSRDWGTDVLKMAVAPNGKLYLLSQNDGIGVFDGKTFTLLN